MSSYIGRHAELYDLFYADKPYAAEAVFVDELVRRHTTGERRRLFELACGTGRHALLFERHGYDVVALDYSESMLAVARRRGQEAGSRVDFRIGDMRSLTVEGPPADAVVCLFDSIGYVQTNEAVDQVLSSVYAHLRPGGVFVFEFWHAAAMLRSYDPTRVRRWQLGNREVIRIAQTSLDSARQLASVEYTILDLGDGIYERLSETQINRYFLLQEMESFVARAGLVPVAWHNGFTASQQIDENTWHILGVARRPT
jgi:SAM-dependent methyltransferase